MTDRFNKKGRLIIPLKGAMHLSRKKVDKKEDEFVVREAYCPKGHNLMSDTKIKDQPGIHFIYTDKKGTIEAEIVISSFVGKCQKKIIKGKAFKKGETVKILCPTCRTELSILFKCECGAPIYLFYLDKNLNHYSGQSFCSRIGCIKSSQLRFSQDLLREVTNKYSF